ncbi:hypothetical protein BR93DRAFT_968441 [Coniochaeta sp. PMI_546]|nr:hypothetical protein BR93DRAFT_968441 [Coniochaeta sp. PMI_546]
MDSKFRAIRDRHLRLVYRYLQRISSRARSTSSPTRGCAYVVGRSSATSNLYSEDESSMDTLDMNWTPQDTTGFIAIQGIRIQKYGERKIKDGEPRHMKT